MRSLMKHVYFKVEFSNGREPRTLHSTPQGWPAGSFLECTVYQLGSSINVPQLLRKAEPIQEIVNISRVVICVPFTHRNEQPL